MKYIWATNLPSEFLTHWWFVSSYGGLGGWLLSIRLRQKRGRPVNILGINYFFHDTSACVVRDGELVSAIEEERLSRDKHTWEFPNRAIAKAVEESGLRPGDITDVAVSIDPWKHWQRKVVFAPKLGRRMRPFLEHELVRVWARQRKLHQWWRSFFDGIGEPRLHFVGHHLAHIAGSFFVSGYDHAALLSADGSGEWSTTWLGEGNGSGLRCISESFFPHSLGSFYETATEFCGFRPNYDEGKTMGLAPFGDPECFGPAMSRLVSVDDRGRVKVDTSWFEYQNAGSRRYGAEYLEAFGTPRKGGEPFEAHHKDVAAAAQRVLEDRVLEMCAVLEKETTAENLVIAGGVALNSVMNGRILRETRFKDIFVIPAAGDNGTAIGAAFYVHNHVTKSTKRYHLDNPYLGPSYTDAQIEAVLKGSKIPYERSENVCVETAKLLHEGKIVGWFQGRMEIGPRALGNRSILCDPTLPHMKDRINAEVKHREAFRPFAPSVVAERAGEFFDIDVESPFMLKVCQVRPEKRDVLPAITHVDGSARLQTVREEINPRYHALISEFGKLSGVPVVLNTSFNVMGEPIVESPLHAIRCFYTTGLDVLVLGDFIVHK
jgi:carbamoyltransferase